MLKTLLGQKKSSSTSSFFAAEFGVDEIMLKILQAMDRVNPKRKQMRKQNAAAAAAAQEDGEAATPAPSVKGKTTPKKGGGSGKGTPREGTADPDGAASESGGAGGGGGGGGAGKGGREKSTGDDLLNLAKVLRELLRHESTLKTKREAEEMMRNVDADMVVDALLFLWNKVKVVFHKYQGGTSSEEIHSYIYKMDSPGRWIFMLETVSVMTVRPRTTAQTTTTTTTTTIVTITTERQQQQQKDNNHHSNNNDTRKSAKTTERHK